MIRTHHLTKRYRKVTALDNLNLVVNEGEIFGYIGPNGAGKTTTLKILATLLAPTSGGAEVCGYSVGRDSRSAPTRTINSFSCPAPFRCGFASSRAGVKHGGCSPTTWPLSQTFVPYLAL